MSELMTRPKAYHPVLRPSHYDLGEGVEVIDVIEDVFGIDGHLPQALAYILRAEKKGAPQQDYAKALWYVRRARRKSMYFEPTSVQILSQSVESALERLAGLQADAAKAIIRAAMASYRVGLWLQHLHTAEMALAELTGEAV